MSPLVAAVASLAFRTLPLITQAPRRGRLAAPVNQPSTGFRKATGRRAPTPSAAAAYGNGAPEQRFSRLRRWPMALLAAVAARRGASRAKAGEGGASRKFAFPTRTALLVGVAVTFYTAGAVGAYLGHQRCWLWIPTALGSFVSAEMQALGHIISPGAARDVLGLLIGTAVIVPSLKRLGVSPIIGFLLMGVLLGPSGLHLIHNEHEAHVIAELGVAFFLFEMGLQLSVAKVLKMKRDVFGLGLFQYFGSSAVIALVAKFLFPGLSTAALIVLGGGLGISTEAFVLQEIKEKGHTQTRYGKAAKGVLLFEDMAVVPLLVELPLLAAAGACAGSIGGVMARTGARSLLALGLIVMLGRVVLNRVFFLVTSVNSKEAFLASTFATILLCSAITEGLGLSAALGAFLAGVLLAETSYRHQIEADIAPFRSLLLGLFFVTVGFQIDLKLLAANWAVCFPLLFGIIAVKGGVHLASCKIWGIPTTSSFRSGSLLATGGEFAFVMFAVAERLHLIPAAATSILISNVALSMALTPSSGRVGAWISTEIRKRKDATGADNTEMELLKKAQSATNFVAVCGYGFIGKKLCQLLDEEGGYNYIAFESNPAIAIEARRAGLPVFLADCAKREVIENFKLKDARIFVIAIDDKAATTAIVSNVRYECPDLLMFARAKDEAHKEELAKFDCAAVVPALPSEATLLSLPFSAAVLRQIGLPEAEIDGLIESQRRMIYERTPGPSKGLLTAFQLVDTDGSGELSPEELRTALTNLGKTFTDDAFSDLFKAADLNENGLIDYEEFLKMNILQ